MHGLNCCRRLTELSGEDSRELVDVATRNGTSTGPAIARILRVRLVSPDNSERGRREQLVADRIAAIHLLFPPGGTRVGT